MEKTTKKKPYEPPRDTFQPTGISRSNGIPLKYPSHLYFVLALGYFKKNHT